MKKIAFTVLLILITYTLQAQLSRRMHQVFEIDSTGTVRIDLWPQIDEYQWEVEAWPSRHIMVETQVGLTNANDAILEFLMEEKRYELKLEKDTDQVLLTNFLEERTPIGTKRGDITENIRLIIYMPEFYSKQSEMIWKRTASSVPSEKNQRR